MSRGTVRIDDQIGTITDLRLVDGALQVRATIEGPMSNDPKTMIMVYGEDGELVCRGITGHVLRYPLLAGDTADITWTLTFQDKMTIEARALGES